ncbi:MAG TPA: hypothetical protein VGG11_12970 [Xanthobacteraceae bacterium]|jgi:hypothetical protein
MGRNNRVPSLGEFLANEAGRAVRDIREKLFDEAWFGRSVATQPAPAIAKAEERDQRTTFEDLWGSKQPHGEVERDTRDPPDEIER